MIGRRRVATLASLFTTCYIAGCAYLIRDRGSFYHSISRWEGRLALKVAADPGQPGSAEQSFSAGFELIGNAAQGSLQLLTPIGSTAAWIEWTTTQAWLKAPAPARKFANLDDLSGHLLGTSVPVLALFEWLGGNALPVDGWTTDLSQREQGKIVARRTQPLPITELRLVITP